MNILLVNPGDGLEQGFRELGHTVVSLQPKSGILLLDNYLRQSHLQPDLLLQRENLGARTYILGLEQAGFPTLFWAIDSHLNMFWQRWYGLLFDGVLTTHISLFQSLPAWCRPAQLHRFGPIGHTRDWRPHAGRERQLALWARLTRERPVRGWMAELLRPEGLYLDQDSNFAEMLQLYENTRVVPNECMCGEVNFRLLEAASAGCLLLSPDIGPDQDTLLQPGKEYLPYHDGLELLDLVRWAAARPAAAERIGRAAYERVRTDHLPQSRARGVLEFAARVSRKRLEGKAAELAAWMTLCLGIRNRTLRLDPALHLQAGSAILDRLPPWHHVPAGWRPLVSHALVQYLCLAAEPVGDASPLALPQALDLCEKWLTESRAALETDLRKNNIGTEFPAVATRGARCASETIRDAGPVMPKTQSAAYDCAHPLLTLELASAASALCLREGRVRQARAIWMGYAANAGSAPEPADLAPADEAVRLCLAWSSALARSGLILHSGLHCVPEKGDLPESALSFAFLGRTLAKDSQTKSAISTHCQRILQGRRDLLYLALGHLAEAQLHAPGDWRLQLQYGLHSLQACRVQEGLFEIAQAREKARAEGRERLFAARLRAWLPARPWAASKERLPAQRDWERLLACGDAAGGQ